MTARIAIALATLALVGCTESDEGIVLCLEGETPIIFDVSVAFLEGPEGPICEPWRHPEPIEMPTCFAANPGDQYGHAMAVKVHWGDMCWKEIVVPFEPGEVVEVDEFLPPCPCDGGDCACRCDDWCGCGDEPPQVFEDAMGHGPELCQPE